MGCFQSTENSRTIVINLVTHGATNLEFEITKARDVNKLLFRKDCQVVYSTWKGLRRLANFYSFKITDDVVSSGADIVVDFGKSSDDAPVIVNLDKVLKRARGIHLGTKAEFAATSGTRSNCVPYQVSRHIPFLDPPTISVTAPLLGAKARDRTRKDESSSSSSTDDKSKKGKKPAFKKGKKPYPKNQKNFGVPQHYGSTWSGYPQNYAAPGYNQMPHPWYPPVIFANPSRPTLPAPQG